MLSTRTGFPRWKRIRKARVDLFGQLVLRGGPLRMTRAVNPLRSRIREIETSYLNFKTFVRTKRYKTLLSLRRRLFFSHFSDPSVSKGGVLTGSRVFNWKNLRARLNFARYKARKNPSYPVSASSTSSLILSSTNSLISKWTSGVARSQLQFQNSRSLVPHLILRGRHKWFYGVSNLGDWVSVQNRGGKDHYCDKLALKKALAFKAALLTLLEKGRALSLIPKVPLPPLNFKDDSTVPPIQSKVDNSILGPIGQMRVTPSSWVRQKVVKRYFNRERKLNYKPRRRSPFFKYDPYHKSRYTRTPPSPYNSSWERWVDSLFRTLFKPVKYFRFKGRRLCFEGGWKRPSLILSHGFYPVLGWKGLRKLIKSRNKNNSSKQYSSAPLPPFFPRGKYNPLLRVRYRSWVDKKNKKIGKGGKKRILKGGGVKRVWGKKGVKKVHCRYLLPNRYQLRFSPLQLRTQLGHTLPAFKKWGLVACVLSPLHLLLPTSTLPATSVVSPFSVAPAIVLKAGEFVNRLVPQMPCTSKSLKPRWVNLRLVYTKYSLNVIQAKVEQFLYRVRRRRLKGLATRGQRLRLNLSTILPPDVRAGLEKVRIKNLLLLRLNRRRGVSGRVSKSRGSPTIPSPHPSGVEHGQPPEPTNSGAGVKNKNKNGGGNTSE